LAFLFACSDKENPEDNLPKPEVEVKWSFNPATLELASKGETKSVIVTANGDWTVTSSQSWCSMEPGSGHNGQTSLRITVTANPNASSRTAALTFTSGKYSQNFTVSQAAATIENYVPAGYSLVWQDEFNVDRLSGGKPALPNTEKWWYENLPKGAVNNELQTYVGGFRGTDTVAAIYDGTLKIVARKSGNDIISARINTIESWTYGYFEARLAGAGRQRYLACFLDAAEEGAAQLAARRRDRYHGVCGLPARCGALHGAHRCLQSHDR